MEEMDEPPAYEESYSSPTGNEPTSDPKVTLHMTIGQEVGASRSQHVAALVSTLLPIIRKRARQGLSKSRLLLLPSNQVPIRKGQLIWIAEDDPTLIQLDSSHDTIEFWEQVEAQEELHKQLLAATVTNPPPKVEQPLLDRPGPPPARSSFFGRKQSKVPETRPAVSVVQELTSVKVGWEEVYFRSETEYGLYETSRGRGILVDIVVQ